MYIFIKIVYNISILNKGDHKVIIGVDEQAPFSKEDMVKSNEMLTKEISLDEIKSVPPKQERVYRINTSMKDGVQYIGKSILTPLTDREHCFTAIVKGQSYIVTARKERGFLIIS